MDRSTARKLKIGLNKNSKLRKEGKGRSNVSVRKVQINSQGMLKPYSIVLLSSIRAVEKRVHFFRAHRCWGL